MSKYNGTSQMTYVDVGNNDQNKILEDIVLSSLRYQKNSSILTACYASIICSLVAILYGFSIYNRSKELPDEKVNLPCDKST